MCCQAGAGHRGVLETHKNIGSYMYFNGNTELIQRPVPVILYQSYCIHAILLFADVEIKREGDKIHRVFQDPTGQHLLVCMESKECYYIGSRLPKRSQPKPLQKVKGQLIESVAWNKVDQSEHSTGPILLGTSTGERY